VAELEFDEENYIVREDTFVIVTRDGWAKRQSSITDVSKVRTREGDSVGWVFRTDTTRTLTYFTNHGGAYTVRADAVMATTGYGDPVKKNLSFADGERVIGVISHDPRHALTVPPEALVDCDPPPPHAVAVSVRGRIIRFPLNALAEESNRTGRRYAKLDDGDAIFAIYASNGTERVAVASSGGRAGSFHVREAPPLKASGKGTTAIKIDDGDQIIAFELAMDDSSGPRVTVRSATKATPVTITYGAYGTARGTAGHTLIRRGSVEDWQREPILQLLPADPTSTAPAADATDEEA
jgi:DNA gyrase subunit A